VRQVDKVLLLSQTLSAFAQRLLDLMAVRYVDEGDDHAVDLVVDRAIGPQPHVVPAPGAAADFAPHRGEIAEHGTCVLDQVLVFEAVSEIGDRPALVDVGDAEQLGHPVGKPVDAQSRIEEQGADIGRRDQVLQIAVGARDRIEFELELGVDGLQLFVDRLQLLFAGLQLFGGRTVFFVDRLQLFVGSA